MNPHPHCNVEIGLLIRTSASLILQARLLLDAALRLPASQRVEAVEAASRRIEDLVASAVSLAHQALRAQRQRTDVSQAGKTIERLIGCGRRALVDLEQAVEACGPTQRQLAAVDLLLRSLRDSQAHTLH